jgi:periplasmic protein TonB
MRKSGTGKTGDIHFAFVVSVVLHIAVVLVFVVLFSGPGRLAETVVADLTFITGPGSVKEGSGQREAGGPDARRAALAPGRRPPASGSETPPDIVKTDLVSPATGQNPSLQLDSAGPVSTYGDQIDAGREEGHGSGHGEGAGGGGGLRVGGGGGGGGGPGNGLTQGEAVQGGSDYYYIRDTVIKNIRYPERARRMGLEGKVVLSFIVLENGATREVKVINGSGFDVLDESAKQGVEKAVMHKRMPHRVMVTLPITYKLQ